MTDAEIIKAFEGCFINCKCDGKCPRYDEADCESGVLRDILSLINRQKAEIERLEKQLVFEIESAYDRGAKTATKEFAEEVKKDGIVRVVGGKYKIVIPADSVDNLVKEMVGDDNENV